MNPTPTAETLTPRTDAFLERGTLDEMLGDFARQLECELTAANAKLAEAEEDVRRLSDMANDVSGFSANLLNTPIASRGEFAVRELDAILSQHSETWWKASRKEETAYEEADTLRAKLSLSEAACAAKDEALKHCHPANIWDKARMYYTHGEQTLDRAEVDWHKERCDEVDKVLASASGSAYAERLRVAEEKVTGWRSMESAPKDGTQILLWDERRKLAISGFYHRDPGQNNPNGYEPPWEAWLSDDDLVMWDDDQADITKWMPIPPLQLTPS